MNLSNHQFIGKYIIPKTWIRGTWTTHQSISHMSRFLLSKTMYWFKKYYSLTTVPEWKFSHWWCTVFVYLSWVPP